MNSEIVENEHFYWENGKVVFTEKYHLNRKWCCGSKCRHCPYFPKYQKYAKEISKKELER